MGREYEQIYAIILVFAIILTLHKLYQVSKDISNIYNSYFYDILLLSVALANTLHFNFDSELSYLLMNFLIVCCSHPLFFHRIIYYIGLLISCVHMTYYLENMYYNTNTKGYLLLLILYILILILKDFSDWYEIHSLGKKELEVFKICHDIKNPLIGNICHIDNNGSIGPTQSQLLRSDLNMILNLVDTIMSGFKLKDFEMNEEEASEIKIGDLVNRINTGVFKLVKTNLINYSVNISSTMPSTFKIQENMIYRILMNLICNSIKHSYNSSVVLDIRCIKNCNLANVPEYLQDQVSAFVEKSRFYVTFEIFDRGMGFSQDKIYTIFDDVDYRYSNYNLGLGFPFVYQMSKRIKSEIFVNSEEGKYTSFYIIVPTTPPVETLTEEVRITSNHRDETKQVQEEYESGLKSISVHNVDCNDVYIELDDKNLNRTYVLFCDDEYSILEYYNRVMEKIGFKNFKTFISHFKLLVHIKEILDEGNYKKLVLFTDKNIPGTNGYELINRVRISCKQYNIQSYEFIVTADPITDSSKGFIEIEKPLSVKKLMNILNTIC